MNEIAEMTPELYGKLLAPTGGPILRRVLASGETVELVEKIHGERMNEPILKLDGRDVFLDSFSGGANPDGELSHLVLRIVSADGTEERRGYTADKVLEGA